MNDKRNLQCQHHKNLISCWARNNIFSYIFSLFLTNTQLQNLGSIEAYLRRPEVLKCLTPITTAIQYSIKCLISRKFIGFIYYRNQIRLVIDKIVIIFIYAGQVDPFISVIHFFIIFFSFSFSIPYLSFVLLSFFFIIIVFLSLYFKVLTITITGQYALKAFSLYCCCCCWFCVTVLFFCVRNSWKQYTGT